MTMNKLEPIHIDEIRAARERIKDTILRTPLVKLNVNDAPAEIFLKLENLQPIGSFKIRGASNAMKKADPETLKNGVWTVSGGNHGQGVAYNAQEMGLDCTVIVPDFVAQTKIDAMERLGATVKKVTLPAEGNQIMTLFDGKLNPEMSGLYIHPFKDSDVMAGQGTIGLEIVEDMPDVDSIVIPWGGGGLACGIASAIRGLKPDTKVYGCEPETASPLASAFKAGKIVSFEYASSFIESAGTPTIWPQMWGLASKLLDNGLTTSVEKTASAVRLIAERNRVIAEGAGALSVAAALEGKAGDGKVVCIVSGASIDLEKLVKIFQGKVPE